METSSATSWLFLRFVGELRFLSLVLHLCYVTSFLRLVDAVSESVDVVLYHTVLLEIPRWRSCIYDLNLLDARDRGSAQRN